MLARYRNPEIRTFLALVLGAALLFRALIPTGWMPARTGDGFTFELCSGLVPGGDPQQMRAARELLDAAMAGAADHDGKDEGAAKDQPCTFASLGAAWISPDLAELPAPIQAPADIQPPALAVAVGRGLTAPPPPSTGPPLLA